MLLVNLFGTRLNLFVFVLVVCGFARLPVSLKLLRCLHNVGYFCFCLLDCGFGVYLT